MAVIRPLANQAGLSHLNGKDHAESVIRIAPDRKRDEREILRIPAQKSARV